MLDSVKELRERTGAGIMDCKAALQSSSGNIEQAIDFLRKKGMAQAAKRAGREAKEGLVDLRIEGSKAALAEVNCETDFVARTDDFKALADLALAEALKAGDAALTSEVLTKRVAELSGKIGEKLLVRRVKRLETQKGVFFGYIHSNRKLGVLVELSAGKDATKNAPGFQGLGKDLAMQVAASNPICVKPAQMPAAVLEREKAIYREEVKGKPENIVEKIVQGKVDKFYKTTCLLEQPYIKDDKQSVGQLVAAAARSLQDTVEVVGFVRFQIGETIA